MWPGSDPKIPAGSSQWQQGRLRGGYGHSASTSSRDKGWDGPEQADVAGRSLRGSEGSDTKQSDKAALKKLSRELSKQARDRKRNQQRQNLANPPTGELYVCPFCEYENFYKKKPRSFIRSFELRERKKREQAEERQRLLDKAKARGRKGKKASRTATSAKTGSSTDSQPHGDQLGDEQQDDVQTGDGYYEDDDDGGGEEDGYGGGDGIAFAPVPGRGAAPRTTSGLGTLSLQSVQPPETYHIPLVS